MGIAVKTTPRYVIEIEHPSSWSPKEDGQHLLDRGDEEALRILENHLIELSTKHDTKYRIISHETSSVTAIRTK